ncbi:MAG: RsmD family RNA methyltransferase [Flavobacteriales bacterium]|jgi:16S rRNA (guanine(966)-N(2))-methyltransferase RsmD|nr:RsmD family RNA methyltransferase [Flavobacteriales bacterium]
MRVIGGKYGRRRFDPPRGMEARPTTDYAKEGLFNVLVHAYPLDGIRVLDLYAGTGNISLEFLSRGAAEVVSVEQDRALAAHVQRTAQQLNEPTWHVVRSDVAAYLNGAHGRFDIIFADPPFHAEGVADLPGRVLASGLLEPDGLLVLEHSARTAVAHVPGYQRTRRYGPVHFSFFHNPHTA